MKARVVYQGRLVASTEVRIVATTDEEDGQLVLVCERLTTDALGAPCWLTVQPGTHTRVRALEAAVLELAADLLEASNAA